MSKKFGLLAIVVLFITGFLFPVKMPHVQLPAEPVAHLGHFIVTNTMVAAWATIMVLSLFFYFASRKMEMLPGRLQNLAEMILESLLGLCEKAGGHHLGRRFLPLIATIFLFILTSNWMGLLPGYGTIGLEHIEEGHKLVFPIFRSANTDLNTTLALAVTSVVATQFFGIQSLGFFKYARRFINFRNPIDFFVGILELVSEVAKMVSFSFRLFGNIFAGEVLLGVMAFLVPWVASIPFMGLELFVGIIQAFVFTMLTLVFLTVATADHEAGHGGNHGDSH